MTNIKSVKFNKFYIFIMRRKLEIFINLLKKNEYAYIKILIIINIFIKSRFNIIKKISSERLTLLIIFIIMKYLIIFLFF